MMIVNIRTLDYNRYVQEIIVMCCVNVTKFRDNVAYYIELSKTENVYITKNGETVAVLSDPSSIAFNNFMNLYGCMKDNDENKSYKDMIGEEIAKKCDF